MLQCVAGSISQKSGLQSLVRCHFFCEFFFFEKVDVELKIYSQSPYLDIDEWSEMTFENVYLEMTLYRVPKTHRMPYLYRLFSAEEPYN